MHKNYEQRARLVKNIVDEHYMPNSHKGSMLDIYRNYVNKVYPMSQVTFYRTMKLMLKLDGYVGNGCNRVYFKVA